MVEVLRPSGLREALEFRARTGARPFGGGTDLMVKYRAYGGLDPDFGPAVLFLDRVEELKVFLREGDTLRIGAGVTLAELLAVPESAPRAVPPVLREAAAGIAAPGLRNRATLAGNIANASPAGDSLPPLYALETRVVLESLRGNRELPLEEFITGPGKTLLEPDEILREIRIPLSGAGGGWYYRKVGTRKANALAKLSLAAVWDRRSGMFRMAAGAVGPRVVRFSQAEVLISGGERDPGRIREICTPAIVPIDDQRSTAEYRKTVCLNLITQCLSRYLEDV